jgi:hypothetical protein
MMQLITRSGEKMTCAILVLLLSQCAASASHVRGVQTYDWLRVQQKTMGAYNQLDSNSALNDQIRYVNLHLSDANAHYCLANTFSKLGQKERALQEYKDALHYSSDNVLSNYCNQAIAAWQGPPPQAGTMDSRQDARYALYYSSPRIPTKTGDIKVDRVIDTIEREGAEVHRQNFWGEEVKQKEFQEEVEDFKTVVSNSRYKFNNGTTPDLDLVGTNLYVRHYATAGANIKPTADAKELIATQELLVLDAHSRAGKTISRVVPESDEHKPQSNSDLKVHGRVMP